jgi:tetratricopeptide (TPR) repeat protein
MHRYDEARDLFRRALRIDQRSLGSHHPNVARDLYNLASVLQASKDFSKAESLYRRALDIDETSFGSLHPNVALDLNGLAESLKATDRTEEAAVASLRAVEILLDFTRCNGREHARLRSTLRTYSAILQSTGLAAPEIRAGVAALLDKYGAPPLDLLLGNA